MRLTVKDGEDHWAWHFRRPCVVFNGEETRWIRELDTEAGYIIRYVLGDDGFPILEGDALKTERLEGTVEVFEAA